MKKIQLILLAVISVAMCSCDMFKSKPSYKLSDLQGLWRQDNAEHFVRFTDESAASVKAGYLWGCEWDEAEDVHETDLVLHGNGWFMYRLNSDELLEIEQMDNEWADIPKTYIVTQLTSSKLTYHPKDYKNENISFTKQ